MAVSQEVIQNLKVLGFCELYDAPRNPLAWHQMAGQSVPVTGCRFFGIAQQRANGQVMTLLQLSGKSDFDLIDCFIGNESMSSASNFKKGDPVMIEGKLAGAPDGYHPRFDGPCIAVAPNKQNDAAADASPVNSDLIVSIDMLEADASSNSAAFESGHYELRVAVSM